MISTHKSYKLLKAIGLVFICLSIFVTAIFLIVFSAMKGDYSDYDFDKIKKNGKDTIAVVTGIEVRENIEIQGKNPYVFTYKYHTNDTSYIGRCEVMENPKVLEVEKGDNVNIKFIGKESMLTDFTINSLSLDFLYVIPFVFLPIGILLFLLGVKMKNKNTIPTPKRN